MTTKQLIFGTTELPEPMEANRWKLPVAKSEHQSLTKKINHDNMEARELCQALTPDTRQAAAKLATETPSKTATRNFTDQDCPKEPLTSTSNIRGLSGLNVSDMLQLLTYTRLISANQIVVTSQQH